MITDYRVQSTIESLSNDKLKAQINLYQDSYSRIAMIKHLSDNHLQSYRTIKLKLVLLRAEYEKRQDHTTR